MNPSVSSPSPAAAGPWLAGLLILVLIGPACGRKALDTRDLESAFASPAATNAAAAPSARQSLTIDSALQQAVAAIHSNDFASAVMPLRFVRAHPQVTPEQLMVVQDTMAQVQQKLADLADRGDTNASRALQFLQSHPR